MHPPIYLKSSAKVRIKIDMDDFNVVPINVEGKF